jgi:signal transduction histidine kinase
LAIVKGIAEAHGGVTGVTSTVGQGTAFTVWLPA